LPSFFSFFHFIQSHIAKTITYILAPIIYHTSTDSYISIFVFNILEFTDTLALYLTYMLFVYAVLLVRNYLYSLNTNDKVSNLDKDAASSNNLKLLNNTTGSNSRRLSQLTQFFTNFFSKKN